MRGETKDLKTEEKRFCLSSLTLMKVYAYKNCSTCKNALKWLRERGVDFDEIAIRETAPTKVELQRALEKLGRKRLFNTSGQDYRALGLKDKVAAMNDEEVTSLLAGNGNLIKRPLLIDERVVLSGFQEAEWSTALA